MILVGNYAVLGNHPGQVDVPRIKRVMLDTNVVSDFTNFYFGAKRVDKESLQRLLLMFPKTSFGMHQVDVNFSLAVKETLWGRLGELTSYRQNRARAMRHAMRVMVEWTPDEVNDWFSRRRPPVDRDKSWPSPVDAADADRGLHPLPMLIIAYGHLLYMSHLARAQKRWRNNNKGKAWPVRELRAWAKDTLGLVGGYELGLAVSLFLDRGEPQDSVRKLLKLGNAQLSPDEVADNAWNAAWDVWFVRHADGATYGLLPTKPERTFVVTHDSDTQFVRAGNEIKMIIDDGRNGVVGTLSTWSDNLKEYDEVEKIMEFDVLEAHERSTRDPDVVLEQAFRAVNALEVEMGVQRLTLDAYRTFER